MILLKNKVDLKIIILHPLGEFKKRKTIDLKIKEQRPLVIFQKIK